MLIKCSGCGSNNNFEVGKSHNCECCGTPLDIPQEMIQLELDEMRKRDVDQRMRENEERFRAEEAEKNKKWYQKPVGIIILLILFFPVGLYLMWKYAHWNKVVKLIVTAIIAVIVIVNLVVPRGNNTTPSYKSTSQEYAQEEANDDTTVATDEKEDETEKSKSEFSPKDVSDETIKSIETYSDYLVMYQAIIDDYLDNYENAVKGTVLYDEATFDDMKTQYKDEFDKQLKDYESLGDQKIVGKDSLVDVLIQYRDSLKEITDAMEESLKSLQ